MITDFQPGSQAVSVLGIVPPPLYILSRFDDSLKLQMEALFSWVAFENTD